MNWIDRLERKYGHICIQNLMTLVVGVQAVLWVLMMFFNSSLYGLLILTRQGLMHGQLWRLITFLFVPQLQTNPLYIIIELYFFYSIGTALERYWGSFRFNLFILIGMLGTIVGALLAGYGDNYGIFLSLFLAYAWENPHQEFLLFFILPVQAKWMGIAAFVLWLLGFFGASLAGKVSLVLGLAGFLAFYGKDVYYYCRDWFVNRRRRNDWNNRWNGRR